MAINTIFQHDISSFRLATYAPGNNHSVTLAWNIDGAISSDLTLFFVSEAEAMPLVRGMAGKDSEVILGGSRFPLISWLAGRDAAEAIEAEVDPDLEEELEENSPDSWDGMLEGSNGENSWDGVSDDGN